MKSTSYLSNETDLDSLATVYTQDTEGNLIVAPLAHEARDWTPGGGGMISTAADYMRFALMLWNGGEYQGVRILQKETVDNMLRLHVPEGVLVGVILSQNEPTEFSGLPAEIFIVQGLAFAGL